MQSSLTEEAEGVKDFRLQRVDLYQDEIDSIQRIGHRSVSDFTNAEIKATEL